MTNGQIADVFAEVADLLEFQGANPFRIRAYRSGARALQNLTTSVATLVEEESDLTELDGIGKDLAAKIAGLVESGELQMLTELRAEVPSGVMAILRIPGLGPKKAAVLHKELKVLSLIHI